MLGGWVLHLVTNGVVVPLSVERRMTTGGSNEDDLLIVVEDPTRESILPSMCLSGLSVLNRNLHGVRTYTKILRV